MSAESGAVLEPRGLLIAGRRLASERWGNFGLFLLFHLGWRMHVWRVVLRHIRRVLLRRLVLWEILRQTPVRGRQLVAHWVGHHGLDRHKVLRRVASIAVDHLGSARPLDLILGMGSLGIYLRLVIGLVLGSLHQLVKDHFITKDIIGWEYMFGYECRGHSKR